MGLFSGVIRKTKQWCVPKTLCMKKPGTFPSMGSCPQVVWSFSIWGTWFNHINYASCSYYFPISWVTIFFKFMNLFKMLWKCGRAKEMTTIDCWVTVWREGWGRIRKSPVVLGRSPGGGNGIPLQYSCLENPVDRRAWWATVHGVTKESDTT